jgi:hypothetical protein
MLFCLYSKRPKNHQIKQASGYQGVSATSPPPTWTGRNTPFDENVPYKTSNSQTHCQQSGNVNNADLLGPRDYQQQG